MPNLWPSTLPDCFTLGGYSEGIGDGRLRSQTDAGPGKIRRRTSAVASALSGSILMTGSQIETLQEFVANTLQGGSLPFWFRSQRSPRPLLVRFGEQLPTWERHAPGKYMVSLSLEVLP